MESKTLDYDRCSRRIARRVCSIVTIIKVVSGSLFRFIPTQAPSRSAMRVSMKSVNSVTRFETRKQARRSPIDGTSNPVTFMPIEVMQLVKETVRS
jgi:hypothetical protein